mgnify:CR=1 FL=1
MEEEELPEPSPDEVINMDPEPDPNEIIDDEIPPSLPQLGIGVYLFIYFIYLFILF